MLKPLQQSKYLRIGMLALLGVIAVTAATREVNHLTELPLERAAGGCYAGELPGFGKVQLNFFPAEPLSAWLKVAWLYREKETLVGDVNSTAEGDFRVDICPVHADTTNATLVFKMAGAGQTIKGTIFNGSNAVAKPFTLTRIYEHYRVRKHLGGLFGRLGVYASASSQIPLLPANSAFAVALNQKLVGVAQRDVRGFTSGNSQRQWEILRYGNVWTAEQDSLWQVRLLADRIASFAVWTYSNPGGANGNLTSWSGHNFWWRDGKLHELKLSDLFLPGADWKSQIRRLCCDDLQRQNYTSESTSVLDEDVSVDEFTISADGLQIYFNPYTIASGGNGEYIVHIPYKLLKPYLRPDVLAAVIHSGSLQ